MPSLLPIIQMVDVSDVADAPANPNKMPPEKYERLKAAIADPRIGFLVPILVHPNPDGSPRPFEVGDGHHRLRAARELGMKQVPAVVRSRDEAAPIIGLGLNNLRGEVDFTEASALVAAVNESAHFTAEELELFTGFGADEIETFLEPTDEPSTEEILVGAQAEVPEAPPAERPYEIKLEFRSREAYTAARRALKKAAGKGGDLSDGLLRILAIDE